MDTIRTCCLGWSYGTWIWEISLLEAVGSLLIIKGIFRDHSRDNAFNFHKIRDFCILVMVLVRMNLTLKGIDKICPHLITKRH